jgi:hypothetical protein
METTVKPIEQSEISTPVALGEPDVLLGIGRAGWLALAGGFIAALAVSLVPLLTYIFSFFEILVHEMGHALAGWFFGYPSIPSFDFFYGGGVTLQQGRFILLTGVVLLLFVILAYRARRHTLMLLTVAATAVIYALLAFSRWHEMLIIALGHGTELIIAGIFLYRAMSGSSILRRAERPVYAFLGFFVVIYSVEFNYRLITDTSFRFEYEYARDGMEMDFVRLANEYLHTGLVTVAKIFMVLALLTPFVSLGCNMVRRMRDNGFSRRLTEVCSSHYPRQTTTPPGRFIATPINKPPSHRV